ncbi:hypothetical protein [Vibrio phage R01]|nr:hypothetical protein [Vibrio phage R01]
MADYTQEQLDALESIKEAGAQFDFELTTLTKNPDEPWLGSNTSIENIKLWACVFPTSTAPAALTEPMFREGTLVESQTRYILAAGEGRTVHPGTGDVMKNLEGSDWAIMGCAPLTVNGQGAIIYEMVVKR